MIVQIGESWHPRCRCLHATTGTHHRKHCQSRHTEQKRCHAEECGILRLKIRPPALCRRGRRLMLAAGAAAGCAILHPDGCAPPFAAAPAVEN